MTDSDLWETRFLTALAQAMPDGPPAEAYLFRRSLIARRNGPGAGAALIAAAAEILSEEGLGRAEIRGCLRAVLDAAPCAPSAAWFWEEGRSDLMELLAPPAPERRRVHWMARASLPVVAVLTVAALSCRV